MTHTNAGPQPRRAVDMLVSPVDDLVVPALLHKLVLRLLESSIDPCVRHDRFGGRDSAETPADGFSGIVVVRVPEEMRGAPLPADVPRGAVTFVVPGAGVVAPLVTRLGPDDAVGTEAALRHLVAIGHRRIGYIAGPAEHLSHRARAATFERVLAAVVPGAEQSAPLHVQGTLEDGGRAGRRLVADGCTAVLCSSDVLGLGVVEAVRDAGFDVPGDVSVIGHGDTVLVGRTHPPLTTVRFPFARLVRTAVDVLTTLHDDDLGDGVLDELLIRPDLIIRGSSGPVASAGVRR